MFSLANIYYRYGSFFSMILNELTKKQISKKLPDSIIWQYQKATWRKRFLPNFIIIGAQKSGTSSLFNYLNQHPRLVGGFIKEINFFNGGVEVGNDNYKKGEKWYRAQFPPENRKLPNSKAFEASPLYLFNPLVPKRIFHSIPDCKLIAVLRDPTDRAISHYFHEKRKGREPLPILEAYKQEEVRLKSVLEAQDFKSRAFRTFSYKSRGRYGEQLDRFLRHFPQQQMLILSSEELFESPKMTLGRIFDFLEVDANMASIDLSPQNVGSNRVKVGPEVHEYLDEYFHPYNQALYELLGKSYGWGNKL
ncbi:MAG: sulfotransferase domain-containing protein [Phormidesmis sp.]